MLIISKLILFQSNADYFETISRQIISIKLEKITSVVYIFHPINNFKVTLIHNLVVLNYRLILLKLLSSFNCSLWAREGGDRGREGRQGISLQRGTTPASSVTSTRMPAQNAATILKLLVPNRHSAPFTHGATSCRLGYIIALQSAFPSSSPEILQAHSVAKFQKLKIYEKKKS